MSTSWKTVRVFISSTFRDMQAERDHLVRFVFPRLREELLPRRIHLVDVDLRWGVTSEQNALEVCREVVDECRPRFLCMLGGRYGSVPAGRSRSITADEIYYGVLDRPVADRGFPYFYFRDEAVTAAMVESTPGEFREPPGSSHENELVGLKQAIIAAGLNPSTYRAQWDGHSRRLTGLQEFGNRVHDDLLAGLESDPALRDRFCGDTGTPPDEFAEENAATEAFVEERSELYVLGSRKTVLDELLAHAHATGGNGTLCLTGAPGSGKSALLAHLSRHPSLSQPSILLIRHFVGASPGSTNVRRTLRRLCHELQAGAFDSAGDLPDDPEALRDTFPVLLRQACARRRVVILLDAVNQLDLAGHSAGLQWLPAELPGNARVLLSALDGPALEELRRRPCQPQEIAVQPLTAADGEAIIERLSSRYRKKLEPEQRAALLAKADAHTPLYLLTALEELRTLGTYEEISQRIADLPPTAPELFAWILNRLENDDGFRDGAGRRVGRELVPHFAALLSASRYGLTPHELADLLDPGDPLGNLAALLRLLRPYLMWRGELLDFYHGQFRTAAKTAWLDTDARRQTAHARLAAYFRYRADPNGQQLWRQDARLLAELPFHLAHAAQGAELVELFSQLSFLAARVATRQVHEQVSDYSLAVSPLPPGLASWRDFLQKHAQRLTQHPEMLVALANHEGFPQARAQAAQVPWKLPWLRTSREPMPAGEAASAQGLRAQVTGKLDFPWGRPSAIASQRAVAFCLERLGTLRVFDLSAMRQTDALLSIRRERPLVLACAPDATSLAVFYESGQGELYRCVFGQNDWPASLERVTGFGFYLPETEDPAVAWQGGAFWYQAAAGTLASISVDNSRAVEEALPGGQEGELSALVFGAGVRLIALRQGADTLLLATGAQPMRREAALLTTACACGERDVAAAFSDGSLVVFELGDRLAAKAKVRAGIVRGALGWDGSRLLWLGKSNGFRAWCPAEDEPVPVHGGEEVFPRHLHILPRQWSLRPDGSLWLNTTHSLVSLRVLPGDAAAEILLEEILGGPVWRAVCKRGKDQWLLEKRPLRQVLLEREMMGRLYCAVDGQGKFFAASGHGTGQVLDLATLHPAALQGCPPGINVAVGEDGSGFWFADRAGDIYFADQAGRCRRVEEIRLPDVHGAHLVNCGSHLVWVGYSSKFFPGTGSEAARTFVFFRKAGPHPAVLERIGEQFRHPREGLCLAACYDRVAGRLVTLWARVVEGVETYILRAGPVPEFARWQFQEIGASGLGPYQFVQADLSADGQWLAAVNRAGEVSCLSVIDGRVSARLACSMPFTAVASGADGPDFWLVEARASVYRCVLVEGAA